MGSMDDKIIDMMNEDWEYVYERERAMIDAQRQYEEEMLMLKWQEEHQHFEQAKIIQEHDRTEETKEVIGHRDGHESVDSADVHTTEARIEGPDGLSVHRETDKPAIQEEPDNSHNR